MSGKRKGWMVIGRVSLIAVVLVSVLATAMSDSRASGNSWSWMSENGYPTLDVVVDDDRIVAPEWDFDCRGGVYQLLDVVGESEARRVCQISFDSSIRFGYFYDYTSYTFRAVVGFGSDNHLYKIRNLGGFEQVSYVPGRDTLLVIQGAQFSVYENFIGRLTLEYNFFRDGILFNNVSFIFDWSNPDFILTRNDGNFRHTENFGVSKNGKWVGIKLLDLGIVRLNLDDLTHKYLGLTDQMQMAFLKHRSNVALSDDGKWVVVAGWNVGFETIRVTEECGVSIFSEAISSNHQTPNSCPKLQMNGSIPIERFRFAYNIDLSSDGGRLSFYAASYIDGKTKRIVMKAAGYGVKQLKYLALGDSYSSGEGDLDDNFYLPATNVEYEKCHVSSRSYPFLLAKQMNIISSQVESVACSGAKTVDVVNSFNNYQFGQGDRLKSYFPNDTATSGYMAAQLQAEAMYSFVPGRAPQDKFVELYTPEIVTVGIGGNDTGIMDLIQSCGSVGDSCNVAVTSSPEHRGAADKISELYDTYVSKFQVLHNTSKQTKIFAVGYPRVVDYDGDCGILGLGLDYNERRFMDESIRYINKVMRAAALTAGIGFIDIYDSFGDHVICGAQESVVNTVVFGDDFTFSEKDFIKLFGNEGFHPNAQGHQMVADSIEARYGDLRLYDYCVDGSNYCPNGSSTMPTLSISEQEYWYGASAPGVRTRYVAMLDNSILSSRDTSFEVNIEEYNLMPDSIVNIEVHSDPISLGSFIVGSDGSLQASVSLPKDLAFGSHTLHLYGQSYTGEEVDFFTPISYFEIVDEAVVIDADKNIASEDGVSTELSVVSVAQAPPLALETYEISSYKQEDNTETNQTYVLGDVSPEESAVVIGNLSQLQTMASGDDGYSAYKIIAYSIALILFVLLIVTVFVRLI
jgi:lysophospholipase L1-like esterase